MLGMRSICGSGGGDGGGAGGTIGTGAGAIGVFSGGSGGRTHNLGRRRGAVEPLHRRGRGFAVTTRRGPITGLVVVWVGLLVGLVVLLVG